MSEGVSEWVGLHKYTTQVTQIKPTSLFAPINNFPLPLSFYLHVVDIPWSDLAEPGSIGQFVKLLQQQSINQAINQSIKQASKQASKQAILFRKKFHYETSTIRVVCNSETENMFDALCFLIIIFFMSNSSGDFNIPSCTSSLN